MQKGAMYEVSLPAKVLTKPYQFINTVLLSFRSILEIGKLLISKLL